uniref:Uncharacterized protein n=1 Tax=Anguilla anguilla TaxID=7936 RepID=A0A0E9VC19_ANGAN
MTSKGTDGGVSTPDLQGLQSKCEAPDLLLSVWYQIH